MEKDGIGILKNTKHKHIIPSIRYKKVKAFWNKINATELNMDLCERRKNILKTLEINNDKDLRIDEHDKDLGVHLTLEGTKDNTKVRYNRKKRHTDLKKYLGKRKYVTLCSKII